MRVAVLAVQGAFIEHIHMLDRLGVATLELRNQDDLARPFDGLILPGGESTTMGRLLREQGMLAPLQKRISAGLPVFGTCAGMILLARYLSNQGEADPLPHFATMDIKVRRNAYGRQLGSFHTVAEMAGLPDFPMTFIRAPYIEAVGPGVEVLARVEGRIIAARQNNQLATSFHPELTADARVHELFLRMIKVADAA
ncbi:MAG: pyridoxal 5'-phosphate synthase glutaminase subunit PdxT [Clostridia bacterium]|nr:pyridoxal 5'-phosphate synthase glutaminase subunit PdxT [Clostridia bacterium]